MSDLEIEILKQKLQVAEKALDEIILGCCNPNVAIRRVMLDLAPIKKALKFIKE